MNLRQGHPRDVPAATNIYPGLLMKTIFSVGTATEDILLLSVLILRRTYSKAILRELSTPENNPSQMDL
jgi:hypothetical protein